MIRRKTCLACSIMSLTLAACSMLTPPAERNRQAEAAFQRALESHKLADEPALPVGDRQALLRQAALHYQAVFNRYGDQAHWSAQALRSLGNIRAEQDRLEEAVACYRRVGRAYPKEDWEVLQAWKAAADLLWDAGRKEEARAFYRQITDRWTGPDLSDVEKRVVRAAKRRLEPAP